MATNYARGRAFEYRVRDYYKKKGWYVVRSAGSKTITDLIAIGKDGTVHFIQCKKDRKIPTRELIDLLEQSMTYKAVPVVAGQNGRKIKLVIPTITGNVDITDVLGEGKLQINISSITKSTPVLTKALSESSKTLYTF